MNKEEKDLLKIRQESTKFMKVHKIKYILDILISGAIGWGALYFAAFKSNSILLSSILSIISILALYRLSVFTHELVHIRYQEFPTLHILWNAIAGIPLLIPHFMYHRIHTIHHNIHEYNGENDGEYFEFYGKKSTIVSYFIKNLFLPIALPFRYLIGSPLSLISKKIRYFVRTHTSSMAIQLDYVRKELPNEKEMKYWNIEETITFMYILSILIIFTQHILQIYLTFVIIVSAILTLNTIRFLCATHWYKKNGKEMTFPEHIKDSIVIDNNSFLNTLIIPVGQKYHGLHHITPSVPGLNLKKFHKHLKKELDKENIYFSICYPSATYVIKKIWRGE